MKKIVQFGEKAEGYNILVLNEREIRAAAGVLFLLMFISVLAVLMRENFTLLKYSVTIFLADILVRVIINPKFSPMLIIGRLIVGNQAPEYVGAEQKKFAWIIGAVLATAIFVHLIIMNAYSPITGIICLICLLFLFFETAFGICLGCKLYPLFYKKKARHCPGEACAIRAIHEIQKTSSGQLFVVLGFIAFILLTAFFFNDNFSRKPLELFADKSSLKVDKE